MMLDAHRCEYNEYKREKESHAAADWLNQSAASR